MKPFLLVLIVCANLSLHSIQAQTPFNAFLESSATYNKTRYSGVLIGTGLAYSVSMTLLYQTWYKKFPKSKFHFFNDNGEWFQMDKLGHATTAYNVAYGCYSLFRWSGKSNSQASWGGASVAMLFLTSIEVFDGFSDAWGFSWGDMAANVAGSALFAGQQLGYGEQKFSLKIGWNRSIYSEYRPDLLGENTAQQLLKDYNGQQIWLSCNIASVLPVGKDFPKWLDIAAGQSVSGLLGARENPELKDKYGKEIKFERRRRWFIGADVDFTRIPTNIPALPPAFQLINCFKIPSPSIEFSPKHKTRFNVFFVGP